MDSVFVYIQNAKLEIYLRHDAFKFGTNALV